MMNPHGNGLYERSKGRLTGTEVRNSSKSSQLLRQNTLYVFSVWLGRLLEYSPLLEQSNGKLQNVSI